MVRKLFKADIPIESYTQDMLDRCEFSRALGDAILRYNEPDSIAIGLYGEWGSGKTSIINMVFEYINQVSQNDERPIIVRFYPWNYSDQNQLIKQFFGQLSIALNRKKYSKAIRNAGKKLETYAKLFEPLAPLFRMGWLGAFLTNIGSGLSKVGDLKSQDLQTIRTELNQLLRNQERKIVIIIDDIDRLNNTEIRQIFQLVRSLGDFPNTIYLLAFDKNVVVK